VVNNYQDSILTLMKKRDKALTPINCLKRHTITPNLRAKMVDWMIEVLCSYKCKD